MIETITLSTSGKRFWKKLTSKHKVMVTVTDKPIELYGAYWDGGSCNSYCTIDKTGNITPLQSTGAPPFDSRPVPSVPMSTDNAIVRGGFFCGKPSTIHIYVTSKDGWNF